MKGAPTTFEVMLADATEQDMEVIHDFISEFNYATNATMCWWQVYLAGLPSIDQDGSDRIAGIISASLSFRAPSF